MQNNSALCLITGKQVQSHSPILKQLTQHSDGECKHSAQFHSFSSISCTAMLRRQGQGTTFNILRHSTLQTCPPLPSCELRCDLSTTCDAVSSSEAVPGLNLLRWQFSEMHNYIWLEAQGTQQHRVQFRIWLTIGCYFLKSHFVFNAKTEQSKTGMKLLQPQAPVDSSRKFHWLK